MTEEQAKAEAAVPTVKLTLQLQEDLRRLGIAEKLFYELRDWVELEVRPICADRLLAEERVRELEAENETLKRDKEFFRTMGIVRT